VHGAEQSWQINLKTADIRELITQIATITTRTCVIDPRVKGKVTVISNTALDEHAIYELFLSVLRVHGYAAVPAGKVVKIVQQTLAKQSGSGADFTATKGGEQLVTQVIPATNVAASELVKILRPMVPQYGHIAAVDFPNVVIVSDHADNIVRLMTLVEQIDVASDEVLEVIPLQEAYVGTMVALLEKIAPAQIGTGAKGPQRVQVVANERNNSLVLKGKRRPVSELMAVILKLDAPATATGSTQVIRLQHADAASVTEILTGLVGAEAQQGEAPVTIRADAALNAIVVRAEPAVMAEVISIVEQLDIRRLQVLIEAAIVEVAVDDTNALGFDWAVVDTGGGTIPLATTALSNSLSVLLGGLFGSGGDESDPDADPDDDVEIGPIEAVQAIGGISQPTLAVARFSTSGVSFAGLVRALATSRDSNLLSTPSIVTLDNEEAKIVVGQNVPFRTGTFTTTASGASNPFNTITREDVGIELTVTPHIHDGSVVRLEVFTEVSSVLPTELDDIVTNKRTIETTILVDDGDTIVLGGLIRDDIAVASSKVPLLGNIPWLGRLFRADTTTRTKLNLLVFLRPTVLRTREEIVVATDRKYQGIWEVSPGPKGEEDAEPPAVETLYEGRRR
ncbi:MAG: type II secretion system secretin GspD, partial [Pseudomonadales bacterium]